MLYHGLIAGILNKLGKLGVIAGFIIGNVLLSYVTNGNSSSIILLKEILIASLGLLAVPKWVGINIEDLIPKNKLLPVTGGKALKGDDTQTINKLNGVSNVAEELAKTYKEVAATIVEEDEKQEDLSIFVEELQNNLSAMESNILYDDITNNSNIQKDIFEILVEKERIKSEDIINIFEKYNNYIMGFDTANTNKTAEQDVLRIVKAINY